MLLDTRRRRRERSGVHRGHITSTAQQDETLDPPSYASLLTICRTRSAHLVLLQSFPNVWPARHAIGPGAAVPIHSRPIVVAMCDRGVC